MKNKIYCFLIAYTIGCANVDSKSSTEWPKSCKEAMKTTHESGIYEIQVRAFSSEPFEVLCDNEEHGGNWAVVMRRFNGSVDFNRNWAGYKNGFGNLNGEFFIGLEKFLIMTTSQGSQELLLLMKDINGQIQYILYDNFILGNENEGYMIKELGEATGPAPNKLTKNVKFTTKDVDNDMNRSYNCADLQSGPGWHQYCFESHLFGLYRSTSEMAKIQWDKELRSVEMLIRPHEEISMTSTFFDF